MIHCRFRVPLVAAIAGAVIPLMLLIASSWMFATWGENKPDNGMKEFSVGLGWLMFLPAALCVKLTGGQIQNLPSLYIVDPLLGAAFFGGVALLWQFLRKDQK